MIGKGKESKYIITKILAMDYFYNYSSPLIFASYFFPFVAYGKEEIRTYNDSEMVEKINNIKNNRHGRFYNFATQGFGNIAFYEPCISFNYFYNKLKCFDYERKKFLKYNSSFNCEIESDIVKNDIKYILSRNELLLKRGSFVLDEIKKELIIDLKYHDNKYVLAKLLFYIISPKHELPDVFAEKQKKIKETFSSDMKIEPNVHLGFRNKMDEKVDDLKKRIRDAIGLQMVFLSGGAFFGYEYMSRNYRDLHKLIENITLYGNKEFIEIVISEHGCEADIESSKYKVSPFHNQIPKENFSKISLNNITLLKSKSKKDILSVKTTKLFLPYALFIVTFKDSSLDYVKVDIYSPFLSDDLERPSMYIFKETNPDLFKHFKSVFNNIWKDDDCSKFV